MPHKELGKNLGNGGRKAYMGQIEHLFWHCVWTEIGGEQVAFDLRGCRIAAWATPKP